MRCSATPAKALPRSSTPCTKSTGCSPSPSSVSSSPVIPSSWPKSEQGAVPPPAYGRPPRAGRDGGVFVKEMVLAAHLEAAYGIDVEAVVPIESIYRIERRDGDPWIARIFDAGRP